MLLDLSDLSNLLIVRFIKFVSSSHSTVLQQFCLLSGLPMAMVVLLPASSKVSLSVADLEIQKGGFRYACSL